MALCNFSRQAARLKSIRSSPIIKDSLLKPAADSQYIRSTMRTP
ncbi:hypothetical protein OHAE_4105 [Ochrobactrum soli]|uniref:Uncharacterized protein n=1 Tax=Ochrobactrum soli TaxID=2448455 RepID=A0A2P9HB34_9HYPH|nr:hypothetical protein OHAE_4105 [[Ochrobactrum] soli]